MKLFGGIVEITKTKIAKYPGDISGDSIIATLKGSGSNPETAQVYGQHGFIGNPPSGTKAIRIRIGNIDIVLSSNSYKAGYPLNQGESKVYSTDSDGNQQGFINLKNDGTIEINGDTDNAVSYSDLNTALQGLASAINSSLATKQDGSGTAGTLTLDLSAAKVNEVKLP